ncbi:DNA-binding response OmpR family regulator [Flavobacterium sp. PL11]|jgi:DNA-binding response OmpR family regulator|uniref:response regulator n=1 Tax=Flavobacterium sp. PL11 TaxID=3071717 RepID=UPI002E06B205|nr:DNA-binding response OmpR family regulator [Flavobacterium sp. PL11]
MINTSILLIDDRETIIESIDKSFKEINFKHKLISVNSTAKAWLMLDGNNKINPVPRIMLIDINRISKDGIQLITAIRNNSNLKSMLIFVLTNSHNQKNKTDILKLNVAGYIVTSFEEKDLLHCLNVLNDYWNIIES